MLADMKKMIDNPDYSDVIFLCKDGVRVHASRLSLVDQSAVFWCMLFNGMAESKLSEINLPDISSTTLLPVMEFLYTGTLQEHGPGNWKHAYEIIGVARFFLLEGLELIAMEYLLVAATEVDTKAAAKFLSMSIEFIGILGKIVDCIAYHLVCTLELSYWYPEDIEALTGEGFRYFLEKTRNEDGEPLFWSKTEFIRLRNVILWCTCKEFPSPWYSLPAEIKSTRYYLDNWKFETNQSSAVYSGAKAVLALSVKPYLPFVNLRRIEPLYLVRIFEPMDIIPSSVLMDAFRFHVLQTSGQTEEYFRWSASCDDTYSTSSEGFVIQRTELGIGFAKYGFCMKNRGRGKWFDWEVIIEEVCDGFIEIGLHHEHDLDGDLIPEEGQSLSGHPGGWALRMDPQGLSIIGKANHGSYSSQGPNYVSREKYNGPGRDYSQLVYGKDFAHKNSKVKFSFDEGRNECFFTLHGDKREEAWDDIPHGYLYPAVSLGSGSNGRVRIKILQIL